MVKLALVGGQQAGKTTVANIIKKMAEAISYKTYLIKFAEPIYKVGGILASASDLYNKDLFFKDTKKRPEKIRGFMQEFSDLAKKYYGEDIFIKAFHNKFISEHIASKYSNNIIFICDDLRYPIEYNYLRAQNWYVAYVYADEGIRKERAKKNNLDFLTDHPSEQYIDDIGKKADFVLYNNSTIEFLSLQVSKMFADIVFGSINIDI